MLEVSPQSPPPEYRCDVGSRRSVLSSVADLSASFNSADEGTIEDEPQVIGPYPPRRPPSMGIAEATRVNALQKERRIEQLRREREAKEFEDCTFTPHLFTSNKGSANKGDSDNISTGFDDESIGDLSADPSQMSVRSVCTSATKSSVPVHERLYALKSKLPRSIAKAKHRPREEIELDGCTFKPEVTPKAPAPPKPVFADGVEKVLPDLAESAGVHITKDGEIFFGSVEPVVMQSLNRSGGIEKRNEKVSTPAISDSQGLEDMAHIGGNCSVDGTSAPKRTKSFCPERPRSFIMLMEEFRQTKQYSSPGKSKAQDGVVNKWNNSDEVSRGDDDSNFVGYSYKDMEKTVRNFENSLSESSINVNQTDKGAESQRSFEFDNDSDSITSRGTAKVTKQNVPNGYVESIVRARLSREQRLRQQNAREQVGSYSEERYKKSRAVAEKGAQPFSFQAVHTIASAAKLNGSTETEINVTSPTRNKEPRYSAIWLC